jgi:hypothetical protein
LEIYQANPRVQNAKSSASMPVAVGPAHNQRLQAEVDDQEIANGETCINHSG